MLNSPCKHPVPLRRGETADPAKLATYYRNRARTCEAAAANSSGHIREFHLSRATSYHKLATRTANAAWLDNMTARFGHGGI
jgi:hypothetical protein